ncbi:MAG: MATE family efflux transporter, partial [Halanaeroarchaeum sp.]
MTEDRGRFLDVWRRTFSLGWPVVAEHTLSTLMRTVDVLVTGLFSPAAVAAVGLADLYGQIPLRVGLGLSTGAITLSSQDTGRGAARTRNRAITQAFVLGALSGLPFVLVGWWMGPLLIDVLGAESTVVRLGGRYLALVFAAAPMRIVGNVGAGSLQGIGDTTTPMYVNGAANLLNIVLTLVLGLGLWVAPPLGIVGVGLGTAISRTVEAVAFAGAIFSARTPIAFTWPRDFTVTRQLVSVSVPRVAEGMSKTLANFPFNGLILLFGTEANAAYHIGRRIFQQISAPSYRAFGVVSNVLVGQTLGSETPGEARFETRVLVWLAVIVLGGLGVVLFLVAEVASGLFTDDPATRNAAIVFTR